jgi:hypothetical protein
MPATRVTAAATVAGLIMLMVCVLWALVQG